MQNAENKHDSVYDVREQSRAEEVDRQTKKKNL